MTGIDDSRFDWADADTTIAHQPRTAIYWNRNGQVVIRQEGEVFEDDPYVFFSVESVPALIEALQWKLIESGLGDPVLDRPESVTAKTVTTARDATGASRSRRYRQRKKQPTERDGDAELLPLAAE